VRNDWSAPTDSATAFRRAGGRRSYNLKRQLERDARRVAVTVLLRQYQQEGVRQHGIQARLARELDFSKATICRDMQSIRRNWLQRWQTTR
jgi:hypothetical protein